MILLTDFLSSDFADLYSSVQECDATKV